MDSHRWPGLADRSFRRFWWGETVSGFGGAFTFLAFQTLVVVTFSGGSTQVGWLNSALLLPYLLLGIVVGALVDRARRRPVMIVTDLVRAGLLGLIPLAWAFDLLSYPLLLCLAVAFGTASLINDAVPMSFVPRLVPHDQLQRAHARLDAASAITQTAGPAAAGALIRIVGAPLSVLVNVATYLFSVIMVMSLRTVPEAGPASAAARPGLIKEIREGVRWVYRRSGLGRLAVATHVWFVGQAVLLVVITPYAYLGLQLSPFQLGLVLAVGGVGAVVGAAVSTKVGIRLGTGGAIICSYLATAIGVGIMLSAELAQSGWAAATVLAIGQWVHGWAMGLSNSHEMSYRQALTPDQLQARTNTTMRSLNRAVLVVVSPLAGLFADRLGFGPALAVAAVIFLGSALIVAFSPLRRVRVS